MSKKQTETNFLAKIPVRKETLAFKTDENGAVTLEIENKGFYNRIAQRLFKKPEISYVHLDEMGSFVWPLIDGERDIAAIGIEVERHFGEKAQPVYGRLIKYFQILESYGFVIF